MKQAFLKFSGKKFISAAFFSATVLVTSFTAKASSDTINPNDVAAVQYTGSTNDGLMLKMHLKNESGEDFTITVKNDNDEVLFTKSYNDVDFNKQFKLLKGDQYSDYYYFTVSSRNKKIEQTYVVNAANRTVDVTAISK